MNYQISKYCKFFNYASESYILNTASGERCNITKSEYDSLINHRDVDPTLLKLLFNKNILFHDQEAIDQYVDTLIDKSNDDSRKRSILYGICLSYECNLRCTYCYEKGIHKKSHVLTQNELDQAFLSILSMHQQYHSNSNKVVIVLFGGEPFVYENKSILDYFFHKTAEIIELFRAIDVECKLTIFSNGLNILSYSELIGENTKMIDSLMLTLNGPKEYHDSLRPNEEGLSSFDKTVETIDFSLSENIAVNVRMDINRESLKYLQEMADFVMMKKWNKNNLFRYYISPIKWTNDDSLLSEVEILKYFFTQKNSVESNLHEVFSLGALRITHNVISLLNQRKFTPNIYHCETVRGQQYVLGSDGLIYRCLVSIGKCSKSFGRFLPKLEIYEDINNDWTNRNISNIPKCKSCEYAFLCAGGCAYVAKEKTGNTYSPICSQVGDVLELCVEAKANKVEIESYGFYYE